MGNGVDKALRKLFLFLLTLFWYFYKQKALFNNKKGISKLLLSLSLHSSNSFIFSKIPVISENKMSQEDGGATYYSNGPFYKKYYVIN